jgi:hypothetical protein
MRLNRGTLIFLALLIIVSAAAYVFINSDSTVSPNMTPTALTKMALFPGLSSSNITSITIKAQVAVEDTRPTPLPGSEALPTLTPVAEGEKAPTETEILAINQDAGGNWLLDESSSLSSTTPIVVATVTTALQTIANTQAESFVPESGDYAQYGLDNPSYEISFVIQESAPAASTTDATPTTPSEPVTRRLRIGDRTFDNLGFYAFLDDDGETVYILSSASTFQSSLLNLVSTPPFAPTPTPIPPAILNVPGPVFSGFNPNIATRFSMTDTTSSRTLVLTKLEDGIDWAIENGDPERTVNQGQITSAFIDFASIQAVSRTTIEDISSVGLDNPAYIITTELNDGRVFQLQVGNLDPSGALYYTLVNEFSEVVLVNATEVNRLLSLLNNPPYAVEVTPEATAEAMAESTEAADAIMAEATEAMTPEATAEMTPEASD